MKGCVQWNAFYCWEDFASRGGSNSVRLDTGEEIEENIKKKTRMDFTRIKKRSASHRSQSKGYEITRSIKLNSLQSMMLIYYIEPEI